MLKWVEVPESVETSWIYKRTKVFDILCKEILEVDLDLDVYVKSPLTPPRGSAKGKRTMGYCDFYNKNIHLAVCMKFSFNFNPIYNEPF